MAIPISQLRRLLGSDEPDYTALARHGPTILPQLTQLVVDQDEYIAGNAASLAGMIDSNEAVAVLQRAAQSPSAQVRIAAAGAFRHLRRPGASGLIAVLLNDRDKGVRKFAIKAAATRENSALRAKLADLSRKDPSPAIRSLASRAASRGGSIQLG
jgi:HEAT repeat protein